MFVNNAIFFRERIFVRLVTSGYCLFVNEDHRKPIRTLSFVNVVQVTPSEYLTPPLVNPPFVLPAEIAKHAKTCDHFTNRNLKMSK